MAISLKSNSLKRFCSQQKLPKNGQSLKDAYEAMSGDPPSDIPFLIWLLENPDSPLPFPGKIDLYRHDCLHILLQRGFSLYDEAFIVGFSMGNDPHTNCFHIALLKLVSSIFYPIKYRFKKEHFIAFDLGVFYGRKVRVKNTHKFNFQLYQDKKVPEVRREIGINIYAIQIMWQAQNLLTKATDNFSHQS